MKEPDFDSSSFKSPDTTPREHEQPVPEGGATAPADVKGHSAGGSTLEQHPDDELYIKKGSRRRRPKYAVFGVLGGLAGLILGLILAQLGTIPADQNYTRIDLTIVLVGLGVPTGVLVALLVALLLDRRRK